MNPFLSFLTNYLQKLPVLIGNYRAEVNPDLSELCLPEFGIRINGDAIVCAAGPSLDTNVLALNRINPNKWIFAVDAAVKTLLDNGISPHFTVISDPQEVINHFFIPCDSILLHEASSNYSFFEKYKRSAVFHLNHSITVHLAEYLFGRQQIGIPAYGSVTNCAISLALAMGANNVYVVGCDYSYTGNHEYCKAYDRVPYPEVIIPGGTNGNMMIRTNMRFLAYSKWLEKFVNSTYAGEAKVWNCTGAGILDIPSMDINDIPSGELGRRHMLIDSGNINIGHVVDKIRVVNDNLCEYISSGKSDGLTHELVEYASGYSGSNEERKLSCVVMINQLSKAIGDLSNVSSSD